MKNKFSFLTALWWILLLAVLGFFLLAATDKHSRESEDENRMLAAFPTLSGKSLADASFMNGFEDFLSDAFFGREGVTKFTDRVMDKFSVLTAEEEAVQKAEEMDRRLQAEGAADGENPAEKPAADAPAETAAPAAPAAPEEPVHEELSVAEADGRRRKEDLFLFPEKSGNLRKDAAHDARLPAGGRADSVHAGAAGVHRQPLDGSA